MHFSGADGDYGEDGPSLLSPGWDDLAIEGEEEIRSAMADEVVTGLLTAEGVEDCDGKVVWKVVVSAQTIAVGENLLLALAAEAAAEIDCSHDAEEDDGNDDVAEIACVLSHVIAVREESRKIGGIVMEISSVG